VVVGPYAVVEAGAVLMDGCVLHAHAMVRGPASLGRGCVVHPFAVVGGEPQAKRHAAGPARVEAGEGNVFREHVTVHGGTEGRVTRIGTGNLFMVGTHVAHDVVVGSGCVFANSTQLAGHAAVEDGVTFGGLSGVTQFVRVGEGAFVASMTACERDVPPFVVVQGNRARVRGVNSVGLRRRGVPEASIRALSRAVHKLWLSALTRAEAVRALETESDPYVQRLLESLTRQARSR
jgi:UDP-N-acetylglucosamine acyltransferase